MKKYQLKINDDGEPKTIYESDSIQEILYYIQFDYNLFCDLSFWMNGQVLD